MSKKKCEDRVCDRYELTVEACGGTKEERRKLLNERLMAAVAKIVQGEFPDQERTTFCENQGGNGGP